MNCGFIIPVIVYIIAEIFYQLGDTVRINRFVVTALNINGCRAKIASVATDTLQGLAMKAQKHREAQLPLRTLFNRIHNDAAGQVELQKPVARLRFGTLLWIRNQVRFGRHAVPPNVLCHLSSFAISSAIRSTILRVINSFSKCVLP